MTKLSEMFNPIREFLFNREPIQVRAGERGGFDWIVFIDKRSGKLLFAAVNVVRTVERAVEVEGKGTIVAGIPIVGGNFEYRSIRERGDKPTILVPGDSDLALMDSLMKDVDVQESIKQGLGSTPTSAYVPKASAEAIVGNYHVDLSAGTIESHVRDSDVTSEQREALEQILMLLKKSYFELPPATYRLNVMLYDAVEGKLKIQAGCNMEGYPDAHLKLGAKEGCAGTAYSSGIRTQVLVDLIAQGRDHARAKGLLVQLDEVGLARKGHERYDVNPDAVWDAMRSVTSVSIIDKNDVPLGTLNVDCDVPLANSVLGTKEVKYSLHLAAGALGHIIGA